ncbi:MAG: 1,6-anhydro-N-acetylmuramyl-L-alanine amidase AmpD [Gammaproteobacteria bacterium]|nr:1,6-anhydro-N-acetylmuramyl-L-alanine amidase AmpD [Gammaproteobacteria bacterium]
MQSLPLLALDSNTGWLQGARHLPSSNHNARPSAEISLLVIHNISLPPGQFGTGMVEALFTNQLPIDAHPYFRDLEGLKVSAHFFISREGAITQFVSCKDRAWHAGISEFMHRKNCNDFSLGIELEGVDDQAYSDAQYQSLNQLVNELTKHYPLITPDRICGHSDIAPERKTDPGPAFIWQRLQAKHSGERS